MKRQGTRRLVPSLHVSLHLRKGQSSLPSHRTCHRLVLPVRIRFDHAVRSHTGEEKVLSDDVDARLARALHRYEIISAYIAETPPRGKRRALLRKLSERVWTRPDGEMVQYSVETLRKWVRRYRKMGLDGLKDAPRQTPGGRVLTPRIIAEACRLKEEVPQRSIGRIIRIMEVTGVAKDATVRRSTLHRALKARGLSARCLTPPEDQDLDRWQADYANDLWQADLLQGPWLPDPEKPGKMRRAYLYAFIDDASRLLLHGRFSFKGELPALELVLRRAVQRWGVPSKVYYDNGMVFRARHLKAVCGYLGIGPPIHTRKYRPMGHGKIEAFNKFCKNAFIAEVKASNISNVEELNEAFIAWVEEEYNTRPHSELQMTPLERFMKDAERRRFADEEDLRQAFLWRETRRTDKCGVFSLFTVKYQTSSTLARRTIEVRYDPEYLDEVEIWHNDRFVERVRPLEILAHRRARTLAQPAPAAPKEPCTDWLGILVARRRKRLDIKRTAPSSRRDELPVGADAFIEALGQALHPDIFDQEQAITFYRRFGPLDIERVIQVLDHLVSAGPADLHLSFYLEEIHKYVQKGLRE